MTVHAVRTVVMAAMALLAIASADAQMVTSVAGVEVKLDAGERQGIRAGMTGKLCRQRKIGGKSVDVCPAVFRITSVTEEAAVATVTRGDATQVESGFRASFDRSLAHKRPKEASVRPRATAASSPARDADPTSILADAELAFDRGEGDRALNLFRRLLKNMPDDEYLARRAGDAAQKVDVAKPPATKTPSKDETTLTNELEAASHEGSADKEKGLAKKILELNPANAIALAVRARSRAITWNRTRTAPAPWSGVAAWEEHLGVFPGDSAAEKEKEHQLEKTVTALSHFSDQSCSALVAKINQVPGDVRSAKWFRAALSQAAGSWSCVFAGVPEQPAARELKLVVMTLRQQRPMPGMTCDISVLGGSTTVHRPMVGEDGRCSTSAPCQHEFALATGEQYQLAIGGGSFRTRNEPVTLVGPATATSFCITQKMTRLVIAPCATPVRQ